MTAGKHLRYWQIKRIKELRNLGLSQTVIAFRMGVSQKTVSKYGGSQ